MIGTVLCALSVGLAWATQRERASTGLPDTHERVR